VILPGAPKCGGQGLGFSAYRYCDPTWGHLSVYNTLNLIYLLYLLNLFYLLLICCDRLAGPEDNIAYVLLTCC